MRLSHISPMLEVNDLEETVAFYTDILGWELTGTWPDTGSMTWAELTAGSVRFMFVTRDPETADQPLALTGQIYLYPDNIDQLWETLKTKAAIAWELQATDYGMREFAIRDCNGYLLTFGQEVEA
ncbi:MAG: VOC family protein [Synechococcales bacterium]|nr:VOC family protein [Synechococcales bacterium]